MCLVYPPAISIGLNILVALDLSKSGCPQEDWERHNTEIAEERDKEQEAMKE